MSRVRVLVVDDSVVACNVLSQLLGSDPGVEVVGSAANGIIALQKIRQVSPDVVVLDVEMPEMDGIETVKQIRATWPTLGVLMCSSLTTLGAESTFRALANGASDYIAKPSQLSGSKRDSIAAFARNLIGKVKLLARVDAAPASSPGRPATARNVASQSRVTALAIGCSTGGPNALATVFQGLTRDLPVPIFIVQHMPPMFTKLLAERLVQCSGIPVREGTDGERVEPGHVYLAPGDFHMTVVRDGPCVRVSLDQSERENSCRPAVDPLFRSVARTYGSGVLAAVMTGMGQDGLRGAQSIVDAGGVVVVQDSATCVVPSMPNAIAAAGIADGIYPLDAIAGEIVKRIKRSAADNSAPAFVRRGGE